MKETTMTLHKLRIALAATILAVAAAPPIDSASAVGIVLTANAIPQVAGGLNDTVDVTGLELGGP
jgi:hypothetical protein